MRESEAKSIGVIQTAKDAKAKSARLQAMIHDMSAQAKTLLHSELSQEFENVRNALLDIENALVERLFIMVDDVFEARRIV